jgi:EAL domain-containing protein (putative c-di-GMP-specific phosphodiesterase class I)
LELTEQRTRDELTRVRFAMHRLRERGVRFALDDLGTGHSSLQSLAELPLDFLKIDIGVVHAVHRSEGKQRLVHRIVEFATKHGLSVVAEGVESEQEARFLIESGCDYLQGFRYGMPAARASRPSV